MPERSPNGQTKGRLPLWILALTFMLPTAVCLFVAFRLLKHFYGTQEGVIAVLTAGAAGGIGTAIGLLIQKLVFRRRDREA